MHVGFGLILSRSVRPEHSRRQRRSISRRYGPPVCTTTNGALLPFNWTQVVKVTAGQKVSTVSNDGVGGTLVVVELTN